MYTPESTETKKEIAKDMECRSTCGGGVRASDTTVVLVLCAGAARASTGTSTGSAAPARLIGNARDGPALGVPGGK